MTDIYEWLEDVNQPLRASLKPMNGDHFAGVPIDEIMPLDLDEDGNTYFDTSYARESSQIDPSLYTATDPAAWTTSGQTIVTVPEHLAEASSKILIYLTQLLKASAEVEEPEEDEMTLIEGQLEALESIDEEDFELPAPGIIDGICVNRNPRAIEIKDVIDHRRIGPNRRTFYLARELGGVYYWFRSPRTDRDHQLRKLISDYCRKSEAEVAGRKPRGFKRLRSGKMVGN